MHVERRINIERELRSAIATNIIEPHYQPVVSLVSNRIVGFEALARWENKTTGHIPPDVFIPIAEDRPHQRSVLSRIFRTFDQATAPVSESCG